MHCTKYRIFIILVALIWLFVTHWVSAEASDKVLSPVYQSFASCNQTVTSYNSKFPQYSRSKCFQKTTGAYYYYLCGDVWECTTDNNQSVSSWEDTQASNSKNTASEEKKPT